MRLNVSWNVGNTKKILLLSLHGLTKIMRKIKNLLLKNAGCQVLQVRLGLGMHVVRSCRLGLGFYRVVESSLIALESFIFSNTLLGIR